MTIALALLATACGDDRASPAPDVDATAADTAIPDTTATDTVADTVEPVDTAPEPDVAPPRVGKAVINEVACQNDPTEWVEIMNVGDAPIDLTGYRVADRPNKSGDRVPAVVLQPGERVVASGDFGLSCGGDEAFLIGGGRVVDVAPVRTGDPEVATWGRFPDGTGAFVETFATPFHANKRLDDERATLFRAEGPMPTVDFYVDAAAEESISRDHHTYVPAVFTWTDETGTSPPQRVDLRIKGAITDRPWTGKPSLKVHFARHDTPGPRAFRGAKKLAFHSMVYDPSTIREWLSYEVMRAMGVPAPRVGWVVIRVNGTKKGLYSVVENYDEVFLRDWFPTTVALYESDGMIPTSLGGFSIDEGDDDVPLQAFSAQVSAVQSNGTSAINDLPDVDWAELTQLFGVEDLLQHTDGMRAACHNFYMHVDEAGFWSFMSWSVDLALIPQYGGAGPVGSCMPLAQICDRDETCRARFERARDEAAQYVMRHDLRTAAVAAATRNQEYADPTNEPWRSNEFWNNIPFDLGKSANEAVDVLEARARAIRCAAAAAQGTVDAENPTCSGFSGGNPGGPK